MGPVGYIEKAEDDTLPLRMHNLTHTQLKWKFNSGLCGPIINIKTMRALKPVRNKRPPTITVRVICLVTKSGSNVQYVHSYNSIQHDTPIVLV